MAPVGSAVSGREWGWMQCTMRQIPLGVEPLLTTTLPVPSASLTGAPRTSTRRSVWIQVCSSCARASINPKTPLAASPPSVLPNATISALTFRWSTLPTTKPFRPTQGTYKSCSMCSRQVMAASQHKCLAQSALVLSMLACSGPSTAVRRRLVCTTLSRLRCTRCLWHGCISVAI